MSSSVSNSPSSATTSSSEVDLANMEGVPPALRAWIASLHAQLEERDRIVASLVREVETLSHRMDLVEAASLSPDVAKSRSNKTLVRRNSGNSLTIDKKLLPPPGDSKLSVTMNASALAASAGSVTPRRVSSSDSITALSSSTSSSGGGGSSGNPSVVMRRDPSAVRKASALGPSMRKSMSTDESISSHRNSLIKLQPETDERDALKSFSAHRDFVPDSHPLSCKIYTRTKNVTVWMPEEVPVDAMDPSPPAFHLKLNTVYGYQGKKCHDNLFELATGEVLYNMGPVCVLLNPETGSQRHYTAHAQEIKCLALHPTRTLVASGEVSAPQNSHANARVVPHVRIWDPETLETKHILGLGDFAKGVGLLQFSPIDDDILVSIAENSQHTMILWDWVNAIKLSEVNIGPEAVYTVDFNPVTRKLVTGGAKGFLYFWTSEVESSEETLKIKLTKKPGLFMPHEKPKAILCMCFSPEGDTVTGDSNGTLYVWPPPVPSHNISHVVPNAHKGGVFALCATSDGFISGGRDGLIKLWTWSYELFHVSGDEQNTINIGGCIRCIAPLYTEDNVRSLSQFYAGTFENSVISVDAGVGRVETVMDGHSGQVSSLVVDPVHHEAVFTAAHDGCIRRWDLQQKKQVWKTEVNIEEFGEPHCIAHSETSVAVATHAGFLLLLSHQGNILEDLRVWRTGIATLQFSPDQSMLALGTDDGCLLIYGNQSPPVKIATFKMINTKVVEVGWSADSVYLRVTLLDHDVWYWSVKEQAPAPVESIQAAEWTMPCRIGWDVQGVWNALTDGAVDINAVALSANKDLMVCGDAASNVRLYRYPCSDAKTIGRPYTGHCGSVDSVSFALEDTCVLSAGGQDMCMYQWQVCERDGRARLHSPSRSSPLRLGAM